MPKVSEERLRRRGHQFAYQPLNAALFGLLAVEIAVKVKESAHASHGTDFTPVVGVVMLAIAIIFVWRSFYAMRIPKKD